MADIRGDGLCTTCSGHGTVNGDPIPREELRPRQQQRHDRGETFYRPRPCPHCDGRDWATTLAEWQAEG